MVLGRRLFVVQERVPTLTQADLVRLHTAVVTAASRLCASGCDVACLDAFYLPATEQWIAVFVADAMQSVRRAVRIAQLPSAQVHEALASSGPDMPAIAQALADQRACRMRSPLSRRSSGP